MIFNFKEIKCIYEVLKILYKGDSKYCLMYEKIKLSHTTLQKSLNQLINKKFILRVALDKHNTNYQITQKGKLLLKSLQDIKRLEC